MIGVIGSGLMGKSIAIEFAINRHDVILISVERDITRDNLWLEIQNLCLKSKYDFAMIERHLKLTHEKEVFLNCNLVIEVMSEDLEKKRKKLIEFKNYINNNCILCSNTSSLSIREIFQDIFPMDRVLGVHFFNPVNLMNLVELSYLDETSMDTLKSVKELLYLVNKEVIIVKNSNGLIVNRILIPMINEAAKLLDSEIASIQDIDKAMKLGANHPIGPLKLADLIGNDVVVAILKNLSNYNNDISISRTLLELVGANHLGRKTKKGFYDYQ